MSSTDRRAVAVNDDRANGNTPTHCEAQYLTVGTRIIPEGRKRPVVIDRIFDRPATVEVYASGRTAFIFPRGQMIRTVAPVWASPSGSNDGYDCNDGTLHLRNRGA